MILTITVPGTKEAHVILDALNYEYQEAEDTGHDESALILGEAADEIWTQIKDEEVA